MYLNSSRRMLWSILVVFGFSALLAACGDSASDGNAEEASSPPAESVEETAGAGPSPKIGFVLPGPTNDGSFNSQALAGIEELEVTLPVDTHYTESVAVPNEGKIMRDYVAQDFDIVWAHSGAYLNSALDVAPKFPDTTFVAVGGAVPDRPENLWIAGTNWEDSYYLAGALAGMVTDTNVIGLVGGVEIPIYVASATAFEEGAKSVNPQVEVRKTFVGDFYDPAKAKEATTAVIERDADVVTHMLNTGAFGVFEAVRGKPVKVIGKDVDQNSLLPEQVITSVELRFDLVMQEIVESFIAGESPDYLPMSLASGLAPLAPFHGLVSDDVQERLEEIKADLIAGKIEHTVAGSTNG